ncbi:MAG: hypothetical protein WEB52_03850 [Dehalococcoidia bacterium]
MMDLYRRIAIALPALAVILVACGGGDNDRTPGATTTPREQFTPGLATAVTTEGAGRTATLGAEAFVSDRTLPADRLSAERLEDAGTATAADGQTIPMARAASDEVAAWELVSPDAAGWLVWRPAVVDGVLEDAGAGATLVSVEDVNWPTACLGAASAGEVCAQVVTPGYRIVIEQGGETITYHASRAGQIRRATSGGD